MLRGNERPQVTTSRSVRCGAIAHHLQRRRPGLTPPDKLQGPARVRQSGHNRAAGPASVIWSSGREALLGDRDKVGPGQAAILVDDRCILGVIVLAVGRGRSCEGVLLDVRFVCWGVMLELGIGGGLPCFCAQGGLDRTESCPSKVKMVASRTGEAWAARGALRGLTSETAVVTENARRSASTSPVRPQRENRCDGIMWQE
jgi:hypothetical protein